MEAIDELGYRQNEVARSLKRRATRTLGVVIPDALNPFHATVALEVERRAHRDGFAVLVAETENDPETENDQVRALVGRRVDGVIFPAVTAGSTIPSELLDRGVPVVVVSFEGSDPRLGTITSTSTPPWTRWSSTWPPSATGGSPSRTPARTRSRSTPGPSARWRWRGAAWHRCRWTQPPPSAAPTT